MIYVYGAAGVAWFVASIWLVDRFHLGRFVLYALFPPSALCVVLAFRESMEPKPSLWWTLAVWLAVGAGATLKTEGLERK